MSLLRVCAFAKCLNRRSLFEKCVTRVFVADCCQLYVSTRSGVVRQISETRLQLQRRNVSFVIPKTEEAKKRVLKQSQLLDVLEARIQQLQCDVVLDVQQANVQFVKASSYGRGVTSGWGPKDVPQERSDIPKSEQSVASKSQPRRWMEKLSQEKEKKIKKQLNLQQKILKKAKESSTVKLKRSESSSLLPGTSHKTISTKIKKSRSSPKLKIQTEKIQAAVSTSDSASGAAGILNQEQKDHINQIEESAVDAQCMVEELAEEEEKLDRAVTNQVSYRTPSGIPEHKNDMDKNISKDIQLSIRSFLEACVYVDSIDRAHQFLLNQHRLRSRRKFLDTDMYNILMRVWAKKGTLKQIGHLFILLEEAGLKPNVGSYCAALESMGRNPNCPPKVISRCLSQMEEDGFSVDDLFNNCVFRRDERDMLLKAIHVVNPNYEPQNKSHTSQCYPSLVQEFYTQRADHTYPKLDFTSDELQQRFKRQLNVEQACTVTIDSVETSKPITENITKMRELLAQQRTYWHKVLLQALREGKNILANTTCHKQRLDLYPFLCLLEDKEYVDIMIQSVTTMLPSGESVKMLARNLGNKVYSRYSVQQKHQNQMVDKLESIYNAYTELLAKDTKESALLPREDWCRLQMEQISGPTLQGCETSWPFKVSIQLGIYLVDLMVKHLKINSNILNSDSNTKLIPILYHMYTYRNTRQIGVIKPHPILIQILQEAMETKLTFDSYVMPMVCPPLPWILPKFGAYLLTPAKLMRTVDGNTQHEELLDNCQNLQAVLDSLNQLGNCAWKINKPVLDTIISIFNDRGSDKLEIPPPLSEAPKVPSMKSVDTNYTASEKAHLKKEVMYAKKKCSEMHSLRMAALYKLSIANHMRDEIFWFPHNMDFRGRTYPCPPYFNHLGSDVTRAILLFAEGKPLGPKGLDWLKIHLVNLTGLKKRSSLQGRLEYANTIMEDILDSADNPMNGKKWWMDADEPWQALACCMEIANAMRSPDPTQFISHFPVHQDGSCNGLQHYAALGRDVIGATSVNLVPCDVPQDVYSGVAQQVEEFRALDAKSGLKVAQVLEGFISRKVVKQTVMTLVYGVTRYGGRLQIEKRLKEIDDFPKEHIWDASHYLVRQVFSGLKEMFTGTREIQDWLTESARLISKSGHTVEWVTPLGLPIIQPYHRTRNQLLNSSLQALHVQTTFDTNERPDTVKQKNAFPPNFIHSLDSTHMMLTALHCYSAGLTFVSVHDCFWTHALTVDTMNKVCREQFVSLHSEPILQDLSKFLIKKYCNYPMTDGKKKKSQDYRRLMLLLASVPQTGDFDLQQVKESTYFFS